jgi:hypothetical protein
MLRAVNRIVVYRADGSTVVRRLTLRERIGLAFAAAFALAVLVALLVVSFLVAIPLIAIFLVFVGRFLWRLRSEVRRARTTP